MSLFEELQEPSKDVKKALPEYQCFETVWLTPEDFVQSVHEFFDGDFLDPCTEPSNPTRARHFLTKEDNSILHDWSKINRNVFFNPPYGTETKDWVLKMKEQVEKGCRLLFLISNTSRTSTGYWHERVFIPQLTQLQFVKKRMHFMDRDGTPQKNNNKAQTVYFYNCDYADLKPFYKHGAIFDLKRVNPEREDQLKLF